MNWLALDIGGANLKVADGLGFADAQSFHLWNKPNLLAESLRALISGSPPADHLAVTMTGELADCYATKTEGVLQILAAVEQAAAHRHTRVYLTNGALVSLEVARRGPLLAAASNWHALARFAGRYAAHGTAVLIDIGSTTCDIVPLIDGKPAAHGSTDTDRLMAGELVYTGVQRSPVCALVNSVPYRGKQCPVMQELFATSWDVYLTLGELPEEPMATHTADGRPATKAGARDRLARCLGTDRDAFTAEDAQLAAETIAQAQTAKIGVALAQVMTRLPKQPATILLSGRGEFLGQRVLRRAKHQATVVSLAEMLGPAVSLCAPAHALAVLAREASRS